MLKTVLAMQKDMTAQSCLGRVAVSRCGGANPCHKYVCGVMRVMPAITESYKHQQRIKKTWVASIDIRHMSVVAKTNSKKPQ